MNYLKPLNLEAAFTAISNGGFPLAGGTVQATELYKKSAIDQTLIDLSELHSLKEIKTTDGGILLGSMVTLSQVIAHSEVKKYLSALVQSASQVGNPNVRNVATIGGNIAIGLPTADLIPPLIVGEAQLIFQKETGKEVRQAITDFITNKPKVPFLIKGIFIPNRLGRQSGYVKYAWRQTSGKTIVNIASSLRVQRQTILQPRLAIGGVTVNPSLLSEVEKMLEGQQVSSSLFQTAAAKAAKAVLKITQPPGEAYRRGLIQEGVFSVLNSLI